MRNILLDYFFNITTITPIPAASTAFLRQVLLVVKPKVSVTPGTITECTTEAAILALTDNTDGAQLLAGGLNKVFVLPSDDLDIATVLNANLGQFFTILVSTDFDNTEITDDLDLGLFKGVTCVQSDNEAFLEAQAVIENRCAFNLDSGGSNAAFAFGKFLSNQNSFRNQQYIQTPFQSAITSLGDYVDLFEKRISFVISDMQFGNRLGFFGVGGKAIVAPYIKKQLEIDLQSRGLTYISANQPQYTRVQAALLQDELQSVIDLYIARQEITAGTIEISLENQNFVATGEIVISEPSGFWRINGTLIQV